MPDSEVEVEGRQGGARAFHLPPLGTNEERERLRAAPPFRCVLSEGHEERPGAPGTLLAENFLDTNLRAWDFTSGEAFRSTHPIIFSYSDDPRSKRAACLGKLREELAIIVPFQLFGPWVL